jgi:hypothetical protein
MIYAIVPVNNGTPDIDFNVAVPIESFQTLETERYCKFPDGTEPRPTWQVITEVEFEAEKPAAPEPTPKQAQPTLQDLQNQINALGQGMVQLLLLQGGGA